MMNYILILSFIVLIVYGIVIFVSVIKERKLKKLRHCSKEELPNALFIFIFIKHRITLAQISNHFLRPMDEIRKILQRSADFKIVKASLDEEDPGGEIWSVG